MGENTKRPLPATLDEAARLCVEICDEAKAENVLLYDVRGTSVLADYFLICSGGSDPHLRAIRSRLEKGLGENGFHARRVSGTPSSHWVILDFGDVLVHIFHMDLRDYYRVEELWDASQLVYRSGDTK